AHPLYRSYDSNLTTAAGQAACAASAACKANASLQHLLFPSHSLFGNSDVFGGVGQQHTDGTSNYNAFQANVTKGLTHGLALIVSYTWTQDIDNGPGPENCGFDVSAL